MKKMERRMTAVMKKKTEREKRNLKERSQGLNEVSSHWILSYPYCITWYVYLSLSFSFPLSVSFSLPLPLLSSIYSSQLGLPCLHEQWQNCKPRWRKRSLCFRPVRIWQRRKGTRQKVNWKRKRKSCWKPSQFIACFDLWWQWMCVIF